MTDQLRAALDDFDAACAQSRDAITATARFARSAQNQSLAFLALAEARAMAYNFAIAPRLDRPRLHGPTSWHSHVYSLGQNCHDFRYGIALLDGRGTYRLHGRVGDLKLALIQVQNTILGDPAAKDVGNTDLLDLAAPDGSVDVLMSAAPQDGPWIQLDPDSGLNFVMVRRILARISDDPGRLRLDRVGGPPPAPLTDPAVMAERLRRAADLERFIVREWCIGLHDTYLRTAGGSNRLGWLDGTAVDLGSPSTTYGFGGWELEPDEALLVEWSPPDTTYWSLQLGDVWSHSLDFFNYQTGLGMADAVLDRDGCFRAVVCAPDPGVPNWLDTRDLREGSIILRNYRARAECSAPTVRKLAVAEVADALPVTVRVGPARRAEQIERRRTRYLDAFDE